MGPNFLTRPNPTHGWTRPMYNCTSLRQLLDPCQTRNKTEQLCRCTLLHNKFAYMATVNFPSANNRQTNTASIHSDTDDDIIISRPNALLISQC